MKKFFIIFLLLSAFSAPGAAWAHGVKLFASVDNNKITGMAYFAGGGPAINSRVLLVDQQNKQILECITDEQGKFEAPLPHNAYGQHTLLLLAGAGHQAEIQLNLTATAMTNPSSSPALQASGQTGDVAATVDRAAQNVSLEEVYQQLFHINKQLLEIKAAQTSITFERVIAGLGYIMGLVGLALYVHYRQRSKPAENNKQ